MEIDLEKIGLAEAEVMELIRKAASAKAEEARMRKLEEWITRVQAEMLELLRESSESFRVTFFYDPARQSPEGVVPEKVEVIRQTDVPSSSFAKAGTKAAEILAMFRQGRSIADIARALQTNSGHVGNVVREGRRRGLI